jgi:myo-inositol-1(or 4)-monophosphatase
MQDGVEIAKFFHTVSPEVIALTNRSLATNSVHVQKTHSSDFATQLDVDVETYLAAEIQKRFPEDTILAEEAHKGTVLGAGRTWVIDPICGTNNLGRSISAYCCNIALVEDGELIASCVIDLAQHEYYWSTGGGMIYKGKEAYVPKKPVGGTVVDIDFGCVAELSREEQTAHLMSIGWLEQNTDYVFVSFNTSLSFLYVALHKLDGVMNVAANLWDIAAATFLGMQSGCVVSQKDGSDWNVFANNVVMAVDLNVHRTLVASLKTGVNKNEEGNAQ